MNLTNLRNAIQTAADLRRDLEAMLPLDPELQITIKGCDRRAQAIERDLTRLLRTEEATRLASLQHCTGANAR